MYVLIGPYPDDGSNCQVDVRIDPYDTWNMDHTLSRIILPMLIQLKETKHGSPNTEDSDVPVELRSTSAAPKENEWDTDEYFHARWDWIMDEMIWAFTQLNLDDNGESQFHSGNSDILWQAEDKDGNPIGKPQAFLDIEKVEGAVTYTMIDGPNHTFKVDYDALKAHEDRIKRGTLLFGKYFLNLWD